MPPPPSPPRIPHSAFRIPRFPNPTRQPFNRVSSGNAGFTLIELIVVMLIIATLAGLIMTGASHLMDNARKVQAKNDINQLVTAANAYYTEYGKYPLATQTTDTLYGKSNTSPGNEDVCNVLRAIALGVNANDVLNPRKIVFMASKDSSRARSGFATASTTDSQGKPINKGAFVDPFGNAYMIAIDGDYDGNTVDSLPYSDLTASYVTVSGNKAVRTGCFAASFGKDGKQGTAGNNKYSGSDDVLSWQ